MNIDFSILEGELPMVKKGREVEIMPFISDDTVIKGRITAINPVVDKNGLVRIKATADNSSGVLYDGMNVRVSISNTVPDKMVVPKTAMDPAAPTDAAWYSRTRTDVPSGTT